MQNGNFNAPSLPYGYSRTNGEITIVEEEAKIVRYIYNSYLNGVGMESIANILNQRINKSNKGFIWCKNTVRYILTNEKYTGNAIFQKFYTTNQFPYKQKENKGERDMYYTEDIMPPIISATTFETVQNLHKKIQHITGHNKGSAYTLSGKMKCSHCGSTYRRKIINGKVNWTCTKHNLNASLCISKPIAESLIKAAFTRMFNKLLTNYTELLIPAYKSLQELEAKQASTKDIIELRRNILYLKEQLRVIAELRTKGFLNDVKYNEQTTEINAKINKLNKEIQRLMQNSNNNSWEIQMLIEYFTNRENIMIEFESETFEFLTDKIIINNNLLEFHIIGGLKFTELI